MLGIIILLVLNEHKSNKMSVLHVAYIRFEIKRVILNYSLLSQGHQYEVFKFQVTETPQQN
jgi:hypothetical protein